MRELCAVKLLLYSAGISDIPCRRQGDIGSYNLSIPAQEYVGISLDKERHAAFPRITTDDSKTEAVNLQRHQSRGIDSVLGRKSENFIKVFFFQF